MTKSSAGRMLGGIGNLSGPPQNAQFHMVVGFLKTHLPQFAESNLNTDIENENGLNSRLCRFIINAAMQENFFADRENMEDKNRGNSPAADIGIYLKVEDIRIDPPLITIFECKRLSKKLPKKRMREYVIGYEDGVKYKQCGGIERFKFAIHGSKLKRAGMIGYIQDGTPDSWQKQINGWICDLHTQSFDPAWSDREKLAFPRTGGRVTEYSSIVFRVESELHLTHLWIDLVL